MSTYTLKEIAENLNGTVVGDPELEIRATAEIDKAKPGEITFLANPKYKSKLEQTAASAVIIDQKSGIQPSIPYIETKDAYYGFLQAFLMFNPPKQLLKPGIHPSAVIHESAQLGADVAIGAHVYIGPQVMIGDRSQIFPNCVLLDATRIGADCIFYPTVSIRENCRIGNRVIIHNGAVIGSDGFGFAPYEGKFHKIPQVGIVVIEDDVELGANVTIDRATMGETIIRAGVKLDNAVQIAHNVIVDDNTVMAAQTGISGSTRIGKNVMMGGQVGISGHIEIGDYVKIAAKSGISKSISPREEVFGYPARPAMLSKRIEASIKNLPDLRKRLIKLEKLVDSLVNKGDKSLSSKE
ncbi:MAG: UDP-3-O-(3-hydroxymyristoyl)glucosamine N-acyltransferase [Calditrichae bacterium]|nr:UDP-3-O-(3-hydroxymyristoyl)glucosamine N-acyltransferase [Calditrichia bacterium]